MSHETQEHYRRNGSDAPELGAILSMASGSYKNSLVKAAKLPPSYINSKEDFCISVFSNQSEFKKYQESKAELAVNVLGANLDLSYAHTNQFQLNDSRVYLVLSIIRLDHEDILDEEKESKEKAPTTGKPKPLHTQGDSVVACHTVGKTIEAVWSWECKSKEELAQTKESAELAAKTGSLAYGSASLGISRTNSTINNNNINKVKVVIGTKGHLADKHPEMKPQALAKENKIDDAIAMVKEIFDQVEPTYVFKWKTSSTVDEAARKSIEISEQYVKRINELEEKILNFIRSANSNANRLKNLNSDDGDEDFDRMVGIHNEKCDCLLKEIKDFRRLLVDFVKSQGAVDKGNDFKKIKDEIDKNFKKIEELNKALDKIYRCLFEPENKESENERYCPVWRFLVKLNSGKISNVNKNTRRLILEELLPEPTEVFYASNPVDKKDQKYHLIKLNVAASEDRIFAAFGLTRKKAVEKSVETLGCDCLIALKPEMRRAFLDGKLPVGVPKPKSEKKLFGESPDYTVLRDKYNKRLEEYKLTLGLKADPTRDSKLKKQAKKLYESQEHIKEYCADKEVFRAYVKGRYGSEDGGQHQIPAPVELKVEYEILKEEQNYSLQEHGVADKPQTVFPFIAMLAHMEDVKVTVLCGYGEEAGKEPNEWKVLYQVGNEGKPEVFLYFEPGPTFEVLIPIDAKKADKYSKAIAINRQASIPVASAPAIVAQPTPVPEVKKEEPKVVTAQEPEKVQQPKPPAEPEASLPWRAASSAASSIRALVTAPFTLVSSWLPSSTTKEQLPVLPAQASQVQSPAP